jgi:UDP-N-acetylmuramoylalanine--D-glutamate ligase
MGITGSTIARFFKQYGETVLVADRDPTKTSQAEKLAALGIQTCLGPHDPAVFENAAMIVTSPGVPLDMPVLEAARSKGIKITGELDVIHGYIREPVVAVTGTNGKTTVTSLISDMLKASGKTVFTCGNIGTPVAEYLLNDGKADVIVAEISSFQLDSSDRFKPNVAVLLNISEDHLDRYARQDLYTESKWSIFQNQTGKDTGVINAQIPGALDRAETMKQQVVLYNLRSGGRPSGVQNSSPRNTLWFAEGMPDLSRTSLKGQHNRENIEAASIAAMTAGADKAAVQEAVNRFQPLRHRFEYAGTVGGTRFYNDSKATNPDAVRCAVEYFSGGVSLIMGGRAKDTDFSCLAETVREKVDRLILIGEAAETIAGQFESKVEIRYAGSMAQAVAQGFHSADPGQTILLSPGCASFDMYSGYAERGDDFTNEVARLKERENESV